MDMKIGMNGCANLVSGCKHGRHWRGPPKSGCGRNGAGRAPRNPASATHKPLSSSRKSF